MTTVYNKNGVPFDIDAIATDLNGKADVDLVNVNNSGTYRGAGWAMPSGTYTDLTLGASGTTYTAPANGWYCFRKGANSGQYVYFINQTKGYEVVHESYANQVCLIFPVSKNDITQINYSVNSDTRQFRFYYAQGSESEAN